MPLRRDIDLLLPDCSNASQLLEDEVASLSAIPMDDSIAETPHAVAKRLQQHGRATKFPWLASSMRLHQNLADCRDLTGALVADMHGEWCRYTSVVQVRPDKAHRSMRLPRHAFCSRMYQMSHLGTTTLKEFQVDPQAEDVPQDPGQGPPPPPPPQEPHDDDAGDEPEGADMPAIAAAVEVRLEKQRVGLMREWLFACLLPSMFASLPWLGDDNGDEETPPFRAGLVAGPEGHDRTSVFGAR